MGVAQPRKRASEFKVLTPKLGSRSLQAGKPRSVHRHRNISVPCLALRGSWKSVPCIPFKKRKSTWAQYHHQLFHDINVLIWIWSSRRFLEKWIFEAPLGNAFISEILNFQSVWLKNLQYCPVSVVLCYKSVVQPIILVSRECTMPSLNLK